MWGDTNLKMATVLWRSLSGKSTAVRENKPYSTKPCKMFWTSLRPESKILTAQIWQEFNISKRILLFIDKGGYYWIYNIFRHVQCFCRNLAVYVYKKTRNLYEISFFQFISFISYPLWNTLSTILIIIITQFKLLVLIYIFYFR